MHRLKWWQIRKVISGYQKRQRTAWETTRWQSWIILCALGSQLDNPQKLIRFSWDKESNEDSGDSQPTDEEYEELQKMMRNENA